MKQRVVQGVVQGDVHVNEFNKREAAWLASRSDSRLDSLLQGAWNCSDLDAMARYNRERARRGMPVLTNADLAGSRG